MYLTDMTDEQMKYYASDIPTEEEQKEAQEVYEASKALSTIAERKDLVIKSTKDQIMAGYLNPLEFYRQAKLFTECIEALKKDPDIIDCAQTEVLKYGKEKPVVNGAVVTMSSRSTPDYSSCGDPVYETLKEQLKAREQFLKSIPSGGVADPETGQIIQAPVVRETSFITVKI